eukprot:IDg6265t1
MNVGCVVCLSTAVDDGSLASGVSRRVRDLGCNVKGEKCSPSAFRSGVRSVRRERRVAECAIPRCPQCAWWASAPMDLILRSCHGL